MHLRFQQTTMRKKETKETTNDAAKEEEVRSEERTHIADDNEKNEGTGTSACAVQAATPEPDKSLETSPEPAVASTEK